MKGRTRRKIVVKITDQLKAIELFTNGLDVSEVIAALGITAFEAEKYRKLYLDSKYSSRKQEKDATDFYLSGDLKRAIEELLSELPDLRRSFKEKRWADFVSGQRAETLRDLFPEISEAVFFLSNGISSWDPSRNMFFISGSRDHFEN